jgi:hypothetical protein
MAFLYARFPDLARVKKAQNTLCADFHISYEILQNGIPELPVGQKY